MPLSEIPSCGSVFVAIAVWDTSDLEEISEDRIEGLVDPRRLERRMQQHFTGSPWRTAPARTGAAFVLHHTLLMPLPICGSTFRSTSETLPSLHYWLARWRSLSRRHSNLIWLLDERPPCGCLQVAAWVCYSTQERSPATPDRRVVSLVPPGP